MKPLTATLLLFALIFTAFPDKLSASDKNQAKPPRLTKHTEYDLIKSLGPGLAFTKKPLPMDQKGLTIKPDGSIVPDDKELVGMTSIGLTMRAGARVIVTDLKFDKRKAVFVINNGPKRKKKWYEHIEVDSVGGGVTPGPPDDNRRNYGSFVIVEFDDYVPEITFDQLKTRVAAVLDFHSVSALEAYLNIVPPIIKEAIKNHKALVGMDKEMMLYAKGRPLDKTREEENGVEYEEWIYGKPPADMDFIRFVGDRVERVETMKVGGEKTIETAKIPEIEEYFDKLAAAEEKKAEEESAPNHGKPPTLKLPCKEGETENCIPSQPDDPRRPN